jgi:hypothetical protein
MSIQDEINKQLDMVQMHQETIRQLRSQQNRCQHAWGPTFYKPIHEEAYEIPGDPPGTMGVDWRGPTYVPAKTTPQWERTCKTCGLVQKTTQSKPSGHQTPIF